MRGALALVLEKSLTMAAQFLAGEHRPLACSSRQFAANRFHFVGSCSSYIKAFALLRKLNSAGCRMLQASGGQRPVLPGKSVERDQYL